MGKNFSCNNSTGKRRKSDFYETPYSMTRHILNRLPIDKNETVLEPSCGNGAISKVLKEFGIKKVIENDISRGQDFLEYDGQKVDWIVTNPPFSLTQEFIKKGKEISDNILLLLPLSYLHGKQRYDEIYTDEDYKLKGVYIFTRYPLLGDELRPDGKYKTGMMVYAWFHFKRGYGGESTIQWIDNNSDILKKSDS